MSYREIRALLLTMLGLTALALLASMLFGCVAPPTPIKRYEARFWIELPDGRVIEYEDWGAR